MVAILIEWAVARFRHIDNTTIAIVKVRTNGDYVDLIDNALLSQGSVNEEAHSEERAIPGGYSGGYN